jgi:Holliday junction resolvasome RuvABC endonuclease subunit
MNTLALDLSTHTGWARHKDGVVDSGVEEFMRGDGGVGERFFRFNQFLRRMTLDESSPRIALLDRIVYEQALGRFATSQAQVFLSVGFTTRIQEHCWRFGMTFNAIPIKTLKKWTTGDGAADKSAMIAAVNERWPGEYEITDDNEADARALLAYDMEARRN